MYFPDRENDAADNREELYKRLLIAKLELLEEETDEKLKEFEELFKAYKSSSKPLIFWQGHDKNTWVRLLKHYEYMYSILEESGFHNAKYLTIFEFYNKIEYIKKRQQQAEKSRK